MLQYSNLPAAAFCNEIARRPVIPYIVDAVTKNESGKFVTKYEVKPVAEYAATSLGLFIVATYYCGIYKSFNYFTAACKNTFSSSKQAFQDFLKK